MQAFPEEMRGDIALHINREMLSLPIFKLASIGCQKSIAQLIGTRFATPGEFLVHRGDAIRNLYFVCSGSLEILDADGSVVALLGELYIYLIMFLYKLPIVYITENYQIKMSCKVDQCMLFCRGQ